MYVFLYTKTCNHRKGFLNSNSFKVGNLISYATSLGETFSVIYVLHEITSIDASDSLTNKQR